MNRARRELGTFDLKGIYKTKYGLVLDKDFLISISSQARSKMANQLCENDGQLRSMFSGVEKFSNLLLDTLTKD